MSNHRGYATSTRMCAAARDHEASCNTEMNSVLETCALHEHHLRAKRQAAHRVRWVYLPPHPSALEQSASWERVLETPSQRCRSGCRSNRCIAGAHHPRRPLPLRRCPLPRVPPPQIWECGSTSASHRTGTASTEPMVAKPATKPGPRCKSAASKTPATPVDTPISSVSSVRALCVLRLLWEITTSARRGGVESVACRQTECERAARRGGRAASTANHGTLVAAAVHSSRAVSGSLAPFHCKTRHFFN